MELAADGATDGSEWVETFNAGLDALDPAQFPLVTRHLPQMYNRSFLMRWKSGNAAPLEDGYNFLIETLILGLEAQAKRARNRDWNRPRRPSRICWTEGPSGSAFSID